MKKRISRTNKRRFPVRALSIAVFSLLLWMPFLADSQTIRYIKADGTGDGSSWNNASGDLQAMINASAANDQVWVARGTYYPSATNNRDAFFNIRKNNVRLYGGFSGTETNVTQRNVSANPTILSGDIGTPGNNNDNSYHIMVIELDPENPQPIDNSTLVDGFTFSDGNASAGSVYNNLYPRYTGSAIFITCNFNSVNITPAIQNCTFINNNAFSSGAVSYEGIAAPGNSCQFINCMFQNNYAGYSGAAIDILQLDAAGYGVPGDFSVRVAGCTFLENIVDNSLQGGANGGTGGGINTFGTGTLWVSNSKFINNRIGTGTLYAGTYKGTAVAIRNGTDATIVNSLAYASNNDVPFYNQQSSLKLVGSTLYNPGSTVLDLNAPAVTSIQNSIVWTDGSTANVINVSSGTAAITISSSVINANYQGTATLSNVLNSNPLFINSAGGDFTLQPGSPAINAGDKTLYNAATMGGADLAGNVRIAENIIDMGAYEANSTPLPVIFGSTAAVIKNNRLTVQWQTESETNNSYFEIEGSANGRDFIKIGKVQSKAKDGNSSTTLQYEYSINANAAAALLGASLLLALCIPAFGGKRKWRIACIICSAGLVLYSCAKNETVVDTAGNKIFLRIAQVDKDGTKDYSKAVLVVRE